MIIKSNKIAYLFDFDGTLFGRNDWISYRVNNKSVKENGPFLNPGEYDINWHILTGRPKIDKFFVWWMCHTRGLHPLSVMTYYTWLFPNHEPQLVLENKLAYMKKLIIGETMLHKQSEKIEKVFYIDNDISVVSFINSKKDIFPIQAITALDFKQENFNILI